MSGVQEGDVQVGQWVRWLDGELALAGRVESLHPLRVRVSMRHGAEWHTWVEVVPLSAVLHVWWQ